MLDSTKSSIEEDSAFNIEPLHDLFQINSEFTISPTRIACQLSAHLIHDIAHKNHELERIFVGERKIIIIIINLVWTCQKENKNKINTIRVVNVPEGKTLNAPFHFYSWTINACICRQ